MLDLFLTVYAIGAAVAIVLALLLSIRDGLDGATGHRPARIRMTRTLGALCAFLALTAAAALAYLRA